MVKPLVDRNPIMQHFTYSHLREGPPRDTSEKCAILAQMMDDYLPQGPEKSAGLRKLLEAKDCFVRAALPTPVLPPASS